MIRSPFAITDPPGRVWRKASLDDRAGQGQEERLPTGTYAVDRRCAGRVRGRGDSGLARQGWHARPDRPGNAHEQHQRVVDSGVLVFREGLETILVLAAIVASFRGGNSAYRRPVMAGGGLALLASCGTWFLAIWVIGMLGDGGLSMQAATGIPAIVVLLLVMNWFFHKVYWTGWISHHNKRRRGVAGRGGGGGRRRHDLGACLARLHFGLSRGLRGRDLPARPARALRLERRAGGLGSGPAVHGGGGGADLRAAPAAALSQAADRHRRDALWSCCG